jgi:hypothetical protein
MSTFRQVSVAALLSVLAAGAFAQAASTPKVDKRQERQEARIQQGAASGSLTAREQKRLNAQQGRIDKAEDMAKADGTVTKKERAGLHHMENKANRNIRRQKHDRQGAASGAKP